MNNINVVLLLGLSVLSFLVEYQIFYSQYVALLHWYMLYVQFVHYCLDVYDMIHSIKTILSILYMYVH